MIYQRGEFTMEGWRKVVAVNLDSLMACALRFRAMLSAAKGSIVVVSSVSGFKSSRGNPAYASSKAGAIGFTRTLASAWASEGIRVNGLAPGLVDTKLTKVTVQHPKRLEAMLAGGPRAAWARRTRWRARHCSWLPRSLRTCTDIRSRSTAA